jgi:predicted nucleotidyltransferase
VLTVLAGTTRALTGREVARLLGRRSHGGVLDALTRLTKQGVVNRQEAGRALMYTLNREHLAAPVVEQLADLRPELLRRLRRAIEAWEIAPAHASLFGSTARGDGDADSDIDLFIVRPDSIAEDDPTWRRQLDSLASQAFRWTGNHVSIAEVGANELKRLRRESPPIVTQLRTDAITLAGAETGVVLGPAR